MKPDNNKIFITILLLMLTMQCFCLLGQSVIQLHRKDGKQKDYLVKTGRRARIKTTDNKIFRGKITEIKDSSIIIGRELKEVSVKNISRIYCKKNIVAYISGGVIFGGISIGVIYLSALTGSSVQLVYAGIISGILIGTVPGTITCYFIFHKKKYDVQKKYDLKIVKAQ